MNCFLDCDNNRSYCPKYFLWENFVKNGLNLHKRCKMLYVNWITYVCIKIMTWLTYINWWVQTAFACNCFKFFFITTCGSNGIFMEFASHKLGVFKSHTTCIYGEYSKSVESLCRLVLSTSLYIHSLILKDTECYKENVGMKVCFMNFSRKLFLCC